MFFICPSCRKELYKKGNSLICDSGHCFDLAKSGYVNLLLGSKGGNHGDNKLMINARRSFLEKGYYSPLQDELVKTVVEFCPPESAVIDCGCGEGYYTNAIAEKVDLIRLCGFDISKQAVALASKRGTKTEYAVASSFDIPVADGSFDAVIEVFSPLCMSEFSRILKKGGLFIQVIPLENHLYELKRAVYDNPYKNEPSFDCPEGFEKVAEKEIKYTMKLESNEDIKNLFMMTPYYYKTGAKEQARLNTLQTLEVKAEFMIFVYKKCE